MANEIYMPISGTIIELNITLLDDSTLINRVPYQQGWIVKINPDHKDDFLTLMSATAFEEYTGAFFRK